MTKSISLPRSSSASEPKFTPDLRCSTATNVDFDVDVDMDFDLNVNLNLNVAIHR
jgi:hypothetical protein